MKNILKKIFKHKIILVIILVIIAFGVRFSWQKIQDGKDEQLQYISAAVQKGSITVSVSGTGQVSVSNQVDIKPEASGQVTYVGVKNGQEVKAGELIAQLNATDALKSVRDAQTNLESAKLSLEKLTQPADELDIIKAENDLAQAQESKLNAEASLDETYEDGFNDIANAFLNLPTIMSGLDDILSGSDLSSNQDNMYYYADAVKEYDDSIIDYRDESYESYQVARNSYNASFNNYKDVSRYSDDEIIAGLISETYETVKEVAEAVKDLNNFIDFHKDLLTQHDKRVQPLVTAHQNTLENYTGITNSHLSSLLSAKNNINNYKEDIINAQRNIKEKEGDLTELLAGTDSLDIKSQELTIKQRENSLFDAQQKLADYYIRAPFDGIIAEVNIQKGESVSSGTIATTLITTQKIAETTLNEIDIAQVQIGQKTILKFDAVEDLSITGEVVEIDTLGTVSQGVVSYDVKITFDIQDERIKPGMSLSADIIIESKRNILIIPGTAIKTMAEDSYVEVLVNSQPQSRTITTGLSDDINVEVIEGLEEGEQIITQTINNGGTSESSVQDSQPSNPMRGIYRIAH